MTITSNDNDSGYAVRDDARAAVARLRPASTRDLATIEARIRCRYAHTPCTPIELIELAAARLLLTVERGIELPALPRAPRSGEREALTGHRPFTLRREAPRAGLRDAKPPRAGLRDAKPPRAGLRDAKPPRFASRTVEPRETRRRRGSAEASR